MTDYPPRYVSRKIMRREALHHESCLNAARRHVAAEAAMFAATNGLSRFVVEVEEHHNLDTVAVVATAEEHHP